MKKKTSIFDKSLIKKALIDSLIKLNPVIQAKNFVMFIVQEQKKT